MVDERGGGGFAIATSDANHASIGVATSKFYFAEYGGALRHELGYHRSGFGDARTFYNLGGIEYALGGVMSFFPRYVVLVEHLLVMGFDASHV